VGLIHQKIKRLREERRLTLKDVADGIGVPLTTRYFAYALRLARHMLLVIPVSLCDPPLATLGTLPIGEGSKFC